MPRIVRRSLVAFCTVITLAFPLLWFRSNRVSDIFVKDGADGRHYELTTLAAQVRLTVVDGWPAREPLRYFRNRPPVGYPIFGHQPLDFRMRHVGTAGRSGTTSFFPRAVGGPDRGGGVRVTYRTFSIPMALFIILIGAFPAWDVLIARQRRLLRERRLTHNLCPRCGYDLRSSPDRCPECGAPVVAHALSATPL